MAESVANKNITENVGSLINITGLKSFWNAAKTYIEQQLSKKYEKSEGGIPKDDLDSSVKASLDKADSALQYSHIDGKYQELLESGTNIKTINGESVLGEGNIEITDGEGCIEIGRASHAEGFETQAGGDYSHAEGISTNSIGEASHSEGDETIARGKQSHAEGHKTEAIGSSSHAEGKNTISYGIHSHTEGEETIAGGQYAEGGTYGDNSHAEGYGAHAIGIASHAEGGGTQSGGLDNYGFVYGNYSHAEGESTNAVGEASHAEGWHTQAVGNYSHAEGSHTIANNEAEHACGRYNVSSQGDTAADKTIFSVGIGDTNEFKNGLEVRYNGDIYIQKDGSYIKLQGEFDTKQDKLAAGANIKTINMNSILGSGNLSLITPTELRNQCYLKSEIDSMLGDINRILESIVNGGNYSYSVAGYSEDDLLDIVDDVLVE